MQINLLTPALLFSLALSVAARAEIKTQITQKMNGNYQTFTRDDQRVLGERSEAYRHISISRNFLESSGTFCTVTYYGPALSYQTQVVLTEGGTSQKFGLGYLPLNGPDYYAVAQGPVPCPKSEAWEGSLAFVNSSGDWDSDFGNNFAFRFDPLAN